MYRSLFSKHNLEKANTKLSQSISAINEATDMEQLMLIEARARETYYGCLNEIIEQDSFSFTVRTRRPPKDELNAMISFGNTLPYNSFLQLIWKTQLDPRIAVVHATNRRSYSLNLDFADLFKPIIVDRVIFTLINRQKIKKERHFENRDEGVFLNRAGKKIFIEEFEKKLSTKIVIKGKEYTYRQLMQSEIWNYQNYVVKAEKYKPYKYY